MSNLIVEIYNRLQEGVTFDRIRNELCENYKSYMHQNSNLVIIDRAFII